VVIRHIALATTEASTAEKTGCDLRGLPDVIDLVIAIRLNEGQPQQ
jgi:hypothetical protein